MGLGFRRLGLRGLGYPSSIFFFDRVCFWGGVRGLVPVLPCFSFDLGVFLLKLKSGKKGTLMI